MNGSIENDFAFRKGPADADEMADRTRRICLMVGGPAKSCFVRESPLLECASQCLAARAARPEIQPASRPTPKLTGA